MRRFINSFTGKAVSQVIVLALVLPFLQFVISPRAQAQLQTLPTWAVVDFEVMNAKGQPDIGKVAAEAVATELAKSGKYDVVPADTVRRNVEQLLLPTPVVDKTSLLRLAAEIRASTIVRGQVNNWEIRNEGGGRKAIVLLRVEVIDVASGLPVNGAALAAHSSVRAASVSDADLLAEALSTGSAQAVAEINSRALPQATILNTSPNEALINHGTRSGFKVGQELVVLRGRTQVATASVIEVEADSATIRARNIILGMQPGDKVRVVVEVPTMYSTITPAGDAKLISKPKRGSNSGFTTLLLVVGVLGVLLSNGRSKGGFSAASKVNAEATTFPEGTGAPAVKVSWERDTFARGDQQTVQWQIYRNDVPGSPVMTVLGAAGHAFDTGDARDVTYGDFGTQVGGNTCLNTEIPEATATAVPGIVPGRPYQYSVALVYKLPAIDLPDGGNASTTGGGGLTTGTGGGLTTGTGGGLTTGGNTTTTTTGGGTAGTADCYFISKISAARGTATPFAPPGLVSPGSNAVVSSDLPFTFSSVVNPAFPITVRYALQISPDPTFPNNRTKTYAEFTRTDIGVLSTGSIQNLLSKLASDFGSSQQEFYWRVGAANVFDKPGPVSAAGQRLVFSLPRRFTTPSAPPPPPAD